MKSLDPNKTVLILAIIAVCLIAVFSGRDLELGPDGLKLHKPPAEQRQTLSAPQKSDTRP